MMNSVSTPILRRLESLCRGNNLELLGDRLADLSALVAADLDRIEMATSRLRGPRAVERSAQHLLGLGGKRLRPICVSLAANLGPHGFDDRALELAVAAELVHAATLLHDDVVDLGETRRGAACARLVFGNAVSIFAGDWLLVDALRRVRTSRVDGALERLLDVIEEMILAESLQLERRGRLDTTEAEWFEVVRGKTAALFRWAMFAGGRAGGLDIDACAALERYGTHLGVAFQAVDDVLDVAGDPAATGKALFADLREGKLTYPLIIAQARAPELAPLLHEIARTESIERASEVRAVLERTDSVAACRALALEHIALAKDALQAFAPCPARDALETVADATVHRPS